MATITVREFQDSAEQVLAAVGRTHEPVVITEDERPVGVLIGIDEWAELQVFRDRKDAEALAHSRAEDQFVPMTAALESFGVDPRELDALLVDRSARGAA